MRSPTDRLFPYCWTTIMKNTKQKYTRSKSERESKGEWIVKIPWVILSLSLSLTVASTLLSRLLASTNLASKSFNCGLCVIRSMSFACAVWESLLMFEHDIISRPMQTEASTKTERAKMIIKKCKQCTYWESTKKRLLFTCRLLFVCSVFCLVRFMVRVNIGQAAPIDKQNGFK